MGRKKMIMGIACLLLMATSIFVFLSQKNHGLPGEIMLKIKEAELILEKNGVKNIAGFDAKYKKIEIDYYYNYEYCLNILKSAAKGFGDSVKIKPAKKPGTTDKDALKEINAQDSSAGLPMAVFRGNAEIYDYGGNYLKSEESFMEVISGPVACSEKGLMFSICGALKNQTALCSKFSVKEENAAVEKSIPKDFACYNSCNVKYFSDKALFSQIWQGPPCSRIEGYVPGENAVKSAECYKDSCKSNLNDISCCKQAKCAGKGKCYPLSATEDIDDDGRIEVCTSINNVSVWANPDLSPETCSIAGFAWFSCANKQDCQYGINSYDGNSNEFCCGDDKDETAIKCNGKLCINDSGTACCSTGSCTFNGKCYWQGCNRLELNSRQAINAYCDGKLNTWIDLDENYCGKCLGESAWSGTICCGDDAGEGKYLIKFNSDNENGTKGVLYHGCSSKKSDCVYPGSKEPFSEGFYTFEEDAPYLEGGYYCKNSQWISLNNNSKYCKKSGYNWDNYKGICCGDNKNEFYIKGEDGTGACCPLPNYIARGGQCYPTASCGNKILDSGELCELPNTENNNYCDQSQQQCLGNKLGARNPKGYCNINCMCEGSNFTYSCVKNACSAECGSDSDCAQGGKCDLNSCSCRQITRCGDNIVQKYNDFAQTEKCEPPNTENNTYCKIEQCIGKKSIFGIMTGKVYGTCKEDCQCDYGAADYVCKKGQCGAECNDDGSGCSTGVCNPESCTCYSLTVCGNGICEEGEQASCQSDCEKGACPYRIDLKLDKANYYLNDTIELVIAAYGRNNNLLPETRFDLDILVNNIPVGSSAYSTSPTGEYTIRKKINDLAPRGVHKYIVKSRVPGCGIVSDTESAYFYVNNPYTIPPQNINYSRIVNDTESAYDYVNNPDTIPPQNINYSRFEFVMDKFDVTNEDIKSKCGDHIIGYGEACEGNGICRSSFGCDYKNKVYDLAEQCSGCSCPEDIKSGLGDEIYCSSCSSCGDGEVNCREECENGTINAGLVCRYGRLYDKINSCSGCKWTDDGITSDILVNTCECKCPENPKDNCANGNYIQYTPEYNGGCSDGKCNACSCADTYTKDSNKDGIEDRCGPEFCANNIDDNDNGLVDEKNCIWNYCSQCGYGLANLCTREECGKFREGCFFNGFFRDFSASNDSIGSCSACSGIKTCEGYNSDITTCKKDPCSIGGCEFYGKQCCTDKDNDGVCDSTDNCLGIINPDQNNSDGDSRGDACESCSSEPALFEPEGQKETACNDGIDNDCDKLTDCKDPDCAGIADCCQSAEDCVQSSCAIEICALNRCSYKNRYLCDNTECSNGTYCDVHGECKEADKSETVCLYCITDSTNQDYGIGFFNLFDVSPKSYDGICCGDDAGEYYIVQKENRRSSCCSSSSACVDNSGKCQPSNTPAFDGHSMHCFMNAWDECSNSKNVLCAEAGFSYRQGIPYKTNNETEWYCTSDGASFGWRQAYPKEICNDHLDNDCDKKIDNDDEDCVNNRQYAHR